MGLISKFNGRWSISNWQTKEIRSLKTSHTTLLTAYTNQSCIQCDEMDIFSPLKDTWRMSRDALKVFMSIDHDPFISWAMHLSTKIYFIIKCIKVNVIQKCITSDKSQIRKKKNHRNLESKVFSFVTKNLLCQWGLRKFLMKTDRNT